MPGYADWSTLGTRFFSLLCEGHRNLQPFRGIFILSSEVESSVLEKDGTGDSPAQLQGFKFLTPSPNTLNKPATTKSQNALQLRATVLPFPGVAV